MKRTAKAASKKGFTLIELVVVVAIIGVLAGLLVPTMLDAVTNSRIASAQQTAKVIRDRSAEFFTKMDTQMHTHVGEVQKVVITVDNGTWSMTGGSAADWVDGVNHWNTLPAMISGRIRNFSRALRFPRRVSARRILRCTLSTPMLSGLR